MKETKIISCKISSSISSLLGNVTSYAESYLASKFPPKFFRNVYINDSLASVNLAGAEIIKLPKPLLIITPQYTAENGFMEVLPLWHTAQYFTFKNPRNNYNGVLSDVENNIFIYSIPDRVKINFEVKIKLPTVMYGYNVMHYIKQSFESTGFFYLNKVNLQTEIPKIYTWYIAKKFKLSTPTVTKYLDDFESKFDRIIFNVFKDTDRDIYKKILS